MGDNTANNDFTDIKLPEVNYSVQSLGDQMPSGMAPGNLDPNVMPNVSQPDPGEMEKLAQGLEGVENEPLNQPPKEPEENPLEKEVDKAKKDIEDSQTEEEKKQKINYHQKILNLSALEHKVRQKATQLQSENTQLQSEITALKEKLASVEEKSNTGFSNEKYLQLAQHNPKALIESLKVDKEFLMDQLLGIAEPRQAAIPEIEPTKQTYTKDEVSKLVDEKVNKALELYKENNEKQSHQRKAENYQNEMAREIQSGNYPISIKVATGQHYQQAYEALEKENNAPPSPKEVVEFVESYLKAEMEGLYKTIHKKPTDTLSQNLNNPSTGVKVKTEGHTTKTDNPYGHLQDEDQELRKLAAKLAG